MEPFRSARELLMSIPGISRIVAELFIAETGADMSVSRPRSISHRGAESARDRTSQRAR